MISGLTMGRGGGGRTFPPFWAGAPPYKQPYKNCNIKNIVNYHLYYPNQNKNCVSPSPLRMLCYATVYGKRLESADLQCLIKD